MKHEITVKGNYVYVNEHSIRFETDKEAEAFVIKLIKGGGLD